MSAVLASRENPGLLRKRQPQAPRAEPAQPGAAQASWVGAGFRPARRRRLGGLPPPAASALQHLSARKKSRKRLAEPPKPGLWTGAEGERGRGRARGSEPATRGFRAGVLRGRPSGASPSGDALSCPLRWGVSGHCGRGVPDLTPPRGQGGDAVPGRGVLAASPGLGGPAAAAAFAGRTDGLG